MFGNWDSVCCDFPVGAILMSTPKVISDYFKSHEGKLDAAIKALLSKIPNPHSMLVKSLIKNKWTIYKETDDWISLEAPKTEHRVLIVTNCDIENQFYYLDSLLKCISKLALWKKMNRLDLIYKIFIVEYN